MIVDKNKFIKIVKGNQAIINKICFGYTRNVEDRHDLKQEILIQLWKAYPKFNHESQLSTWIYRIALNTAISNFRKSKRKIQESELSQSNHQMPEVNDNTELDENIVQLYQLIYQLNDLEKAIMLLYLDDKPYKVIADIIGISETNVATKINRIKSKLKNQFSKN
ncbi:ECF RNA polymerase sigma factor SigG [subsurface metagenome]